MPSNIVVSLYRLPEVECRDEEGSLLLSIRRPDPRSIDMSELFLFLGWILNL